MNIEIKVKGCPLKQVGEFKEFQGALKELSPEAKMKLKSSILRNGFNSPIFLWAGHNSILDGHQRIVVISELIAEGHTLNDNLLPYVEIEADNEKQAAELVLSYNSQYGEITEKGLDLFISDFKLDIPELRGFLNLSPELSIMEEPEKVLEEVVPEDPENIQTNIKQGQIYKLGQHRVMCGDSTKQENVKILLGGGLVDMVFTSPPYNVDINYNEYPDKKSKEEYLNFIKSVMDICFSIMSDGRFICWNIGVSPKTFSHLQGALLDDAGFMFWRQICWKKSGVSYPVFLNTQKDPKAGNYRPNFQHEIIFLFTKGQADFRGRIQPNEKYSNDVWEIHQSQATVDLQTIGYDKGMTMHAKKSHPAAYPVELPTAGMIHLTTEQENIFDPFGGSGSTLIAAEKNNRKCYIMEIDPSYCEVICRRWETLTGKKRELTRDDPNGT